MARHTLVDYAIAYMEPPLFDIASALWRNGRIGENGATCDARRAGRFVREYHREHRLTTDDVSAIVTYMKCRGLQLQQRLELHGGADETVMARVRSVCT